jgi:uncharacterized protein (DUF1015 family)
MNPTRCQIFPFRGLRYDVTQAGSLNQVTAPPYDVINPQEQEAFYAQSPYNVVRLILNQAEPGDTLENGVYSRAAKFFQDWQAEGVLQMDEAPGFYAYTQTWQEASGNTIERKGLIGLLKLEPFETGVVLPHERTLGGPKADRLNLMKTALGNFSQIFMIYDDSACQLESLLEKRQDLAWSKATDGDGVLHQLGLIQDEASCASLQQMFSNQVLLIADGHHRYETALNFKAEVRQTLYRDKNLPEPPEGSLLSDYVMVFLTNMNDPGLKVYPTHRVLYKWPDGWNQERFEAEFFSRVKALETYSENSWGYWSSTHEDFTQVDATQAQPVLALAEVLQGLDVAQLDAVVFDGIFNTSANDLKAQGVLGFYRNEAELRQKMASGEVVAVFWMDTPNVAQIRQVSMAGLRMPQKSTYFYPKTLSGLVLYPYHPNVKQPNVNSLTGVVADPVPVITPLSLGSTYQPALSQMNR